MPGKQPERHPRRPELLRAARRGLAPVGQVVAGVGVPEEARLRVEDGVEAGDEHVGRYVLDHHVVYPLEDLARRVEALGRGAEQRAGRRHHESRWHALVRHVADDEAELAVFELQEVVEVAAHLARRLVVGRELVAGQVGHVSWEGVSVGSGAPP